MAVLPDPQDQSVSAVWPPICGPSSLQNGSIRKSARVETLRPARARNSAARRAESRKFRDAHFTSESDHAPKSFHPEPPESSAYLRHAKARWQSPARAAVIATFYAPRSGLSFGTSVIASGRPICVSALGLRPPPTRIRSATVMLASADSAPAWPLLPEHKPWPAATRPGFLWISSRSRGCKQDVLRRVARERLAQIHAEDL